MKYFTAELYAQFNSRNIDAADRADTLWDKVEKRYEARLGRIRSRLPAKVRQLTDKLCLHDAEVVRLGRSKAGAHLLLQLGNRLHLMSYRLTRPLIVGKPRSGNPFSPNGVRWLYDEVDLLRSGDFTHEILLSDGRELKIVFDRFNCTAFDSQPLDLPIANSANLKQTAVAIEE